VQRMASSDLVRWQPVTDGLPLLPLWAKPGTTWAPAALKRGLTYVLYYTVRDRASGRQCISRAMSVLPQGPYLDLSLGPLVCQLDRGGSIDPEPVLDAAGTPYLVWKSDDNALGRPTVLWAQRLTPDGLSLTGPVAALLANDRPWEGPAIEGPARVGAGGQYYLFYGAHRWDSDTSGIGYATCQTPLGPCTKVTTDGPWLASRANAPGPAGPSVFTGTDGSLRFGYHAWTPGRIGYSAGGVRQLWIERLAFVNGQPVLIG
jgi:beta-xylosidase